MYFNDILFKPKHWLHTRLPLYIVTPSLPESYFLYYTASKRSRSQQRSNTKAEVIQFTQDDTLESAMETLQQIH